MIFVCVFIQIQYIYFNGIYSIKCIDYNYIILHAIFLYSNIRTAFLLNFHLIQITCNLYKNTQFFASLRCSSVHTSEQKVIEIRANLTGVKNVIDFNILTHSWTVFGPIKHI